MYTYVNRIVILLALFAFSACEPAEIIDPSFPLRAAPEIPPAEMYLMPLELLTAIEADTSGKSRQRKLRPTYYHWAHSTLSLVAWNTRIALHTAIPLTAFGLAVNQEPILIEEDRYEWTYSYKAPPFLGDKTYDIVLTGTYVGANEVEWKMNLSEEGGFQNFEWFSAIVATDFSRGNFVIYQQAPQPQPVLNITFEGLLSNSEVPNPALKLRYTDLDPDAEEIGTYVEFRTEPENTYNRVFDIKGGPQRPDLSTEIEWNIPIGEGRVRDKARFGDNDWHCWNEQLQDVGC